MDKKDENQEDLVVSSTGQMLTKDEPQQIAVKEEPQQEPQEEVSAQQQSQGDSGVGGPADQPTGLMPPEMPTSDALPPNQDNTLSQVADDSNNSTPQDDTVTEVMQPMQIAGNPQEDNGGIDDANFASMHSYHDRSVNNTSHSSRNNKKVLVILIVTVSVFLSGIALFVYLSTQENVAEVDNSPVTNQSQNNRQNESTIQDSSLTDDEITSDSEQLPVDPNLDQQSVDTLTDIPIDENSQSVDQLNDASASPQTETTQPLQN